MAISNYKVVVGAGYWSLSGVHVFAVHLVRGLRKIGVDAQLLMTEQNTWLVSRPPKPMAIPTDIPVVELKAPYQGTWADQWTHLIEYLEGLKPCVYLPNVDFRHSCVSPKLSPGVAIVGILQGDDPVHYEHVKRLGKYWDAISCVSDELAERTAALDPSVRGRLHTIPNAVPVPETCPPRASTPGAPLKFIYHGVLNTYQKRILDMPLILGELERHNIAAELTIAGTGPEQEELLKQCAPFLESGRMRYLGFVEHEKVEELLREHDVYINTSKFEGMPHAMLEAMAQGCVPVVTDIASGVPEVVKDGENGYRVPIGGIAQFAERLGDLARDPAKRRRFALSAHQTVKFSRYNVDNMVKAYRDLFERILGDARRGRFRRPPGPVLPPPKEVAGLSIFPVEHAEFVAEVDRRLPPTPRPKARGTFWHQLAGAFRRGAAKGSAGS